MRTSRPGTLLVPALLAVALLASACSGQPGEASKGGEPGSSGGSSGSSGGSSGSNSGSSGSSSGSSGGTQGCVGTTSKAERLALDIYIMLDRSYSMDEQAGASTKWEAVSSALTSFVEQPLESTSVGLQYFPQEDFTQPQGNSCNAATYATPEVEIGPLGQTASLIRTSIGAKSRGSGTPTSAALQGAVDHARAWAAGKAGNEGHAVVVIFATDGDPTTCDTDLARIDAIAAAGLSATPSVRTFVIGVGNLRANLDRIARAGGTSAAFIVDTGGSVSTQFLEALNAIRAQVVGCSYAIPAAPPGQQLDHGRVNVDYQPGGAGAAIPFERVAGAGACGTRASAWHYDDATQPTRITLCPGACSTIQADKAASVRIVLGCNSLGEW